MILSDAVAREIAGHLLDIEAVRLRPESPFTWASGWRSPIYCDNRLTLSHSAIRDRIKGILSQAIAQAYPQAGAVAGVATAGIAHGVLAADALSLPFAYVRASAKGHGMGNRIEGELKPGTKVVVIEDLISTGGSSLSAVEALREADLEVVGLLALFTYGFERAQKAFEQAQCPVHTLSDYATLIDLAMTRGLVAERDRASLEQWRNAPEAWPLAEKAGSKAHR
jgi:orotate phosphoribosyltransferase